MKIALDTGEAASVEEAEALFRQYRLHVAVGRDVSRSRSMQAAVVTAINAAARCFLGGVTVSGPSEVMLRAPYPSGQTLAEAAHALNGQFVNEPPRNVPVLLIGDASSRDSESLVLRVTFREWTAVVGPEDDGVRLGEHGDFSPVGVLAGALGVSEAFQYVRGTNAAAGRRTTGMSLWKPGVHYSVMESGPDVDRLPAQLWLIGLGNLGQAVMWTLGLLPYEDPRQVELVLQDYDDVVPANQSTSLLTTAELVGQKKTRTMAKWCEQRGFRTVITERRFDERFSVATHEPRVAVCGVDNPLARAALEGVGFDRIVEAGLGAGATE
jgi:hypothetical protein